MVKLSDYGLIKAGYSRENTEAVLYDAPEAFKEQRELKSDVWSLGITLVELGKGENPFEGIDASDIRECVCDDDPPSLSNEKWSAECVDFVAKCLVKDVKERWDASELMEVSSCICGFRRSTRL